MRHPIAGAAGGVRSLRSNTCRASSTGLTGSIFTMCWHTHRRLLIVAAWLEPILSLETLWPASLRGTGGLGSKICHRRRSRVLRAQARADGIVCRLDHGALRVAHRTMVQLSFARSFVSFAQVNRANHEFQVSPRRRRDQAGLAAPRSIRLAQHRPQLRPRATEASQLRTFA